MCCCELQVTIETVTLAMSARVSWSENGTDILSHFIICSRTVFVTNAVSMLFNRGTVNKRERKKRIANPSLVNIYEFNLKKGHTDSVKFSIFPAV